MVVHRVYLQYRVRKIFRSSSSKLKTVKGSCNVEAMRLKFNDELLISSILNSWLMGGGRGNGCEGIEGVKNTYSK
jgi:hypothetical protein